MDIELIKKNKLQTLLQFAIPSIIAMLLETVITITDGFFTGNYVGESALAAINLGLPVLYLYLGLGLSIGVGGSVICARLIGEGNKGKADCVFSQTGFTIILLGIITSILIGVLFVPIMNLLQVNAELTAYFSDYYRIMLLAYPLMVLGTALGIFVRVDGKPQVCMFVSIAGCVLNALLDYILMNVFGMGIKGSAVATLAVNAVTVVAQLIYFFSRVSNLKFVRFRFDFDVNKETVLNGSSEFIGEMSSAISMFAFNYVLVKYVGVEGVAAFTILGFTVYGYSMIAIGFGQGLTAPTSVLWGAKEYETAVGLRKLTNRILFVTGLVFAVSFIIFGRGYAGMFGCSDEVVNMVSSGFRYFVVSFILMGYDVTNSMYFTACTDAKSSAVISSLRGIIILIPLTFIFPALWGMNGVWLVTPTTESVAAIVSCLLIYKQKMSMKVSERICY